VRPDAGPWRTASNGFRLDEKHVLVAFLDAKFERRECFISIAESGIKPGERQYADILALGLRFLRFSPVFLFLELEALLPISA